MSKFIKAKATIEETIIELQENGSIGDKINLKELIQVDASIIRQKINSQMENEINMRVKEKLEAQKLSISNSIEEKYKSSILELNAKINSLSSECAKKPLEIEIATSDKDKKIATLSTQIESLINTSQKDVQTAVQATELKFHRQVNEKDLKIKLLEDQLYNKKFVLKIGTKDLGEDLETYCKNIYDEEIHDLIPDATFKKYNEMHKNEDTGKNEKGDFVFRYKLSENYEISIVFELKNRDEQATAKNLNDSKKFEKLERDRKGAPGGECKYAVLVTMLDPDDEFSIKKIQEYQNSWMVRPQHFKQILLWIIDRERSIFNATKRINDELAELQLENKENLQFEQSLTEQKKNIFMSYKKLISNFDDDSKDLIDILKNVIKLWKRRNVEKKHYKSTVTKVLELSSKDSDSIDLKNLKKELKSLNSKELQFTNKENESRELASLVNKTIETNDDFQDDGEKDDGEKIFLNA